MYPAPEDRQFRLELNCRMDSKFMEQEELYNLVKLALTEKQWVLLDHLEREFPHDENCIVLPNKKSELTKKTSENEFLLITIGEDVRTMKVCDFYEQELATIKIKN